VEETVSLSNERVERRLAAILAADMVGYSRLMEADEKGTVVRQKACREELIDPEIAAHNGRIVKLMGDGMLVEFASAVDALECAVQIQRAMPERNMGVPEDSQIIYRMGINLGDVLIDGDDILGDGVNVAARLEPLAEPGGICIADVVFNSVKGKLDLGYAALGPQKVKNIIEPIRAHHVLLDPADRGKLVDLQIDENSQIGRISLVLVGIIAVLTIAVIWWRPWTVLPGNDWSGRLPNRPSIAVLPFESLSQDKNQEYFADGISEDIIVGLSKVSGLFVIARNSTFAYKNRQTDVKQVAKELGVRNILTGSVRRSEDQLRISAQLTDAVKGNTIWGDQFDRKVTDVFAVQSEIGERVVRALSVTLKANEQERLFRTHTQSIPAYELFLKARKTHLQATPATLARASELYTKIVELDSTFAGGYAGLSVVLSVSIRLGYSSDPPADARRALELANKAVSVDPEFGWSYIALGGAHIVLHNADAAVSAVQQAVEFQPNDADSLLFLGFYKAFAGRPASGVEDIKASMLLDPKPNVRQCFFLGNAYYVNSQFDDAVAAFAKCDEFAQSRASLILLAASYAMTGDKVRAAAASKRYLTKNPHFNASSWNFVKNYKLAEHRELILEGLRKAGFPHAAD